MTKALVTKYPKGTLFVLEDLSNVRQATEKVHICNRYVSVSWAYYQFRQMLEYKAELYGHKVVIVPPHEDRRSVRPFALSGRYKCKRSVSSDTYTSH